jgi:hypothetical protein
VNLLPALHMVFDNAFVGNFSMTIRLPGEMFAVFEKIKSSDSARLALSFESIRKRSQNNVVGKCRSSI